MARTLTTKDAYALINLMVKEQLGENATIQAVNPSSFVSAGETLLAAGTENTLNTLALVLGRTLVSVRPYKAKFASITAINNGAYANRLRKISFYRKEAVTTGADNTDLKTNFADGYDNGSNSGSSAASMWEQSQPKPLQMTFGGSSEWQYPITVYDHQLKAAFRSPEEFASFVDGIMTAAANDIESEKEAFARTTLLNAVAGCYDLNQGGSKINMVTEFNNRFGTSYTASDLLGTHLEEFSMFFVAYVKTLSDKLTIRSKNYHWAPTLSGYVLPRHTPKAKQKMLLYKPFWNEVEAIVKPAIFNDHYLNVDNFEGVEYWQNVNNPSKISITPAIPNISTPSSQTSGAAVALDYVLGFIFDEDAVMIDMQLENAEVTPLEARKHYRNIWYTFRKNAINDFTENMVMLYMA